MRVVHSVASLAEASGGPSRVIPALCDALARAGAEVVLVAGDDGRPMLPPQLAALRLAPAGGIGTAVREALAPGTVLHDHGLWGRSNRAATAAARGTSTPYVVNVHGMLEPHALAHHGWRKRVGWAAFQRRDLERAAALVATAPHEAATIHARLPGRPVATIANGVDLPATLPAPRGDDGPATCLFLSRLHPVKNLIGLVEAWARIAADPAFDRWTLRIAGPDEGGHRAVVERRIAALGLGNRVVLAGPVADADKMDEFAACDLFVLPSLTENFGIVAAEALAHGVPVVATTGTPWSALPEIDAGWWVAPDPAALADALRTAMALPAAARRAMGARGRAHVAARFGWDRVAADTLALYRWVRDGGARPGCVDA